MNDHLRGPRSDRGIAAEVLQRAHAFADERAAARYWRDLEIWSRTDDSALPKWHQYEPGLWEELLVLCEGLGELAAVDPQLLFPPTDPWSLGYG